jgi:hypothetical protein
MQRLTMLSAQAQNEHRSRMAKQNLRRETHLTRLSNVDTWCRSGIWELPMKGWLGGERRRRSPRGNLEKYDLKRKKWGWVDDDGHAIKRRVEGRNEI